MLIFLQRIWINVGYFKLTLFDPPEFIVGNIYGLRHLVLMKLGFESPSLWQRLNSFAFKVYFFHGVLLLGITLIPKIWI